MKPSIFNENDLVLLLGEGNFSFAVSLLQLKLQINIVATCYESNVTQETAKKNIEYLKENDIRVLLGIDATNLTKSVLKNEKYDKIIFNFPHVGGKMRIEKNRDLLKQSFLSIKPLLHDNGLVLVTLCNGQGGTVMDTPQRRWDDSWKITEMAAHGDFILFDIQPFVWSMFEDYTVTGYRSLEKGFHSAGALTHIFKKSAEVNLRNIAAPIKIDVSEYMNSDITWADLKSHISSEFSLNKKSSLYHAYTFDITLCTDEDFSNGLLYSVLYNCAGGIISNVDYIDSYKNSESTVEKKTYRITYNSDVIPLHRKKIIHIHQNILADIIERNLKVLVSR